MKELKDNIALDEEIIDDSSNDSSEGNEETIDSSIDSTKSIEKEQITDVSTEDNEEIIEATDESTKEKIETTEANVKPKKIGILKRRKIRRREKFKNMILNPEDIKYVGPLSYRHLRIIAWIAFAIGQYVMISNLATSLLKTNLIPNGLSTFLDIFSDLSTPLFLMAIFAVIFSQQKTYKSAVVFYAAAFLSIGIGFLLFYSRYVSMLVAKMGYDITTASESLGDAIGRRAQINVFADLLSLTLFHFFINYNPHKFFKGKKKILFRLMILFPIAYLVTSYILIGLDAAGSIALRFEIFPFLTTKSPMVHILFISLSIWIKNRERIFLKLGGTRAEYKKYLKTNRNSLFFSIQASVLFAIFSFVDFIALIVVAAIRYMKNGMDMDQAIFFAQRLGFSQCAILFIAIPFILLFSYQKKYKNNTMDIIIPFIGIGLTAFAYFEGIFEMVMILLTQ